MLKTQSGSDAQQDAAQGELDATVPAVVFAQNGYADAKKGDEHSQKGKAGHVLAQQQPGGDGGKGAGQRHEELSEAAADEQVAVEQAVVAEDEAHEAAGLEGNVPGQGTSAEDPEGEAQQQDAQDHAPHIERERAQPFAGHLRKEGCEGPHQGHQ